MEGRAFKTEQPSGRVHQQALPLPDLEGHYDYPCLSANARAGKKLGQTQPRKRHRANYRLGGRARSDVHTLISGPFTYIVRTPRAGPGNGTVVGPQLHLPKAKQHAVVARKSRHQATSKTPDGLITQQLTATRFTANALGMLPFPPPHD